jgi:threonine dehydratase
MIDTYVKEGFNHFAISSSGNAALAAAYYANELNEKKKDKINLEILIGRHIATKKLRKLEGFKNENIKVTMHDRPLQTLFTITKDQSVKALRQSTDDLALSGYRSLAEELLEIPKLEAVFIGTSSGTTAQALAQYFVDNKHKVEIHVVQTSSCHPIADSFNEDEIVNEESIADAIVDHTAIRKSILVDLIRKSNGNAWIVSNDQIRSAQEITKINTELNISTNSALSVAGLMQAIYTSRTWKGSVACLICGD